MRRRFAVWMTGSSLLFGVVCAGCSGKSTPPGGSALSPPAADSAVEIPPPPPSIGELPVQALARMRAQVDSVPLEADHGTLMQAAAMARNMGDMWRTEELLRALLKQSPADRKARTRLADTLEREMRLAEARALYDSLRRDDTRDVRAYLGLASVSLSEQKRGEAWKWLEQGAERCAANAADLVLIAQRYQEWDDLTAADRVLARAEAVSSEDAGVKIARASLLIRAARPGEARAVLGVLVSREPENAEAWKTLAKAWSVDVIGATDAAKARACAERTVALSAGDPEAHRYAAAIFRSVGEPRRAAKEMALALTAAPGQTEARYALARLYGELGKADWQKAQLRVYERVRGLQRERDLAIGRASQRPMDIAAHLDVGRASEMLGDVPSALRELQAAAVLAPQDASARGALQGLYNRLAWGNAPSGPRR